MNEIKLENYQILRMMIGLPVRTLLRLTQSDLNRQII